MQIAVQLGLTEAEKARRRLPQDVRRWKFAPKKRDDSDDGGLFGAMDESSDED